jgi:hypothetical protein
MKFLFLSMTFAAFLLSGCAYMRANEAGYQARLEAMKGTHIDQLVMAWGPPDAEFTFEDGRKMYAFVTSKMFLTPRIRPGFVGMSRFYGQRFGSHFEDEEMEMKHLFCETHIITDKEGLIMEWKFKGNACRAVPPADQSPAPSDASHLAVQKT